MTRRHFGQVDKLPSGRYRARYTHEGELYAAPETFANATAAGTWLAAKETEINAGGWIDPSRGKQTFGDYSTAWLKMRSDLSPTTRAKYTGLLNRHILPTMGDIEMAKLGSSASRVRAWYHELAKRHQTTADDAYRCLRAIVNTAIADGHLAKSPCTVKGAGTVKSAERVIGSIPEVRAAVEVTQERYRAGYALAAWCHLRKGEVLGLTRRSVDLLHATVRVEQEWVQPLGATRPVLKAPKSEAGFRLVDIPANILPLIEAHLDRFVGPSPDAWLYGSGDGSHGDPMLPRNFYRAWEKARLKVGKPDLTMHDLRHSGLTWAAATGAPIAELMARGGHASSRAALRYQHATREGGKVIADDLADMANVIPLRG